MRSEEEAGKLNYELQVPGIGVKLYHVNFLKRDANPGKPMPFMLHRLG